MKIRRDAFTLVFQFLVFYLHLYTNLKTQCIKELLKSNPICSIMTIR
jgi:hypothetical protein